MGYLINITCGEKVVDKGLFINITKRKQYDGVFDTLNLGCCGTGITLGENSRTVGLEEGWIVWF